MLSPESANLGWVRKTRVRRDSRGRKPCVATPAGGPEPHLSERVYLFEPKLGRDAAKVHLEFDPLDRGPAVEPAQAVGGGPAEAISKQVGK